ncbi:MAG: hypothetical protein R2939_22920 [Kofleriaceae bacterium]
MRSRPSSAARWLWGTLPGFGERAPFLLDALIFTGFFDECMTCTDYALCPQCLGSYDTQAFAVGAGHVCFSNTEAYCFGFDTDGQLGTDVSAVENPFVSLLGVVYTRWAAGPRHTCATTSVPDIVQCWGDNAGGQLGVDPSLEGDRARLGAVPRAPPSSSPPATPSPVPPPAPS